VDDVVLLRAGVIVYAPRIHWSAKHVEWLLARASLPYVAIGIGNAFSEQRDIAGFRLDWADGRSGPI